MFFIDIFLALKIFHFLKGSLNHFSCKIKKNPNVAKKKKLNTMIPFFFHLQAKMNKQMRFRHVTLRLFFIFYFFFILFKIYKKFSCFYTYFWKHLKNINEKCVSFFLRKFITFGLVDGGRS